MGSMLSSHSEGFLGIANLKIHFDGKFWFTGIDVCSFSFGVFSPVSLNETFGLIDEDSLPGLWLTLACNCESRVEITNIFIHTDGFVSLSSLDELNLSFFVSLFVLKFKSELQMHISDFMFGVLVCHLESLIEITLVREILDNCINEVHLQHHFHSLLRTQRLCPLLGKLACVLIFPI